MQVIEPLKVTPAMLVSSTCDEPAAGEVVWANVGKSRGERVINLTTHRTYECIQDHATGKDPTLAANAAFWKDVGGTMRWKMLDVDREEGTTSASPLIVEFAAGARVGGLGMVGLDADKAKVEVLLDGVVKRTVNFQLRTREFRGWRGYFFAPFRQRRKLGVFDLPPYSAAHIRITAEKASGPPTIGTLVMGMPESLGTTKPAAENDARSFSTWDRTNAGASTLIKRKSSPITSQVTNVDGRDFARLERLRARLDAVPCLWSGLDETEGNVLEPLLQVAVHTRFLLTMTDELYGELQLELLGP
jgi:hypothetical protein